MCLAGAVIASWSLTEEVAGWSPFTVMTNILSLNSIKHLRKSSLSLEKIILNKEDDKLSKYHWVSGHKNVVVIPRYVYDPIILNPCYLAFSI